ncbi:amino acid adenylation domain-containing protein [Leptospira vanthielii]|uniref:AMP-binding enzyme n=1 Tax=Leptospira vanthielii serovar Holland str. Waz Holland = ATCC 700522 TaxID=1218591 RepID=N1W926_9LEPT|nr:amino acid adenylation domain-containing protein [Leptospira vanthielii]EMY69950.1 AMP-binding enzyme [Leptospira vanthielii serovar Holland str. Waz Holland = ATCC 700522]
MSYSRLSTQQLDIYKEQLLYPSSTIYNLIGVVSINGKIDVGNFIEVVRFFVSNSPILNSKISIIDNVPVLERINDRDIKLEVIEYDQTQDISEFYNTFIDKVSLVPFDIKSDNRLCSFSILHLSNKNLYLVAKFHHILIDAWGANLALNQVIKSYNNICSGKMDGPPVQYDYSVYLNNELEYLASDKYQKDKRFWKSEFLTKPEQLFKKQYQNIDPLNCKIEKVIISRREYELLSNSVSHLNSNFFHITLGMLFVLFNKLNGTSNFCVGIPVLNRKNSYFLNTIGLFVSVFPLRIDFDGEFTLSELVTNIISKLKTNYRFQRFPVSEISREVNIDSATKIPLYEIALSNINFDSNEKIESAEVEYLHVPNKAQALPVSVYIGDFDDNNDICIDFIFNESCFTNVQIRSMLDSFSRLMSMFPEAIDTKIKEIDLVSFAEAEKFSACISESTDQPFVPIHKLFESIAVEYSDRIAIVSDAKALTYRELNEKANMLSDFLMHTCSVRKGECIGVQIDNSEYLVVALLAILKIGASYIPIDMKVPEDRLSFMLVDSRSKLLLSENDFENIGINYINVIKIFETSFDLNSCNPNCVIEEYDSIYTIYTSGSTGDPKGATVSHGSFSNLMKWYIGLFDKQRGNSTLLVAPISFDLAQKNIFAPLLTGSKLYLHKFIFMDYDYIKKVLLGEPIEYINCAPSAFYPLVNFGELGEGYEHLERLQILVLGGEPINGKNLVNWIQSDRFSTRLINTYGPTECTDISSSYEITKQEISEAKSIPIGKPILNSRTYILDKYSRILPPGFVGEIAIGGKGVGKGYINNYQLTKERFIKDAYSSGLIYLTGDMGVYRENGIIEYYGRLDNQVKVNGYRVELEEIEKQLNKSEFIQSSVVVLDNKGKLLSYVIPK